VYTYIVNQFYGGGAQSNQVELELKSVAYNAINSYRSNLVLAGNGQYNGSQAAFIELLIGPSMTANTSPASVGDVLDDVENNIGISDLSVNEQTPLFMATVLGKAAYNYWSSKIVGANPWTPKFSTVAGQNYMNTLKWNVGAMSGALSGYGSSFEGLVEPNTNAVSNRMIAAVMGALTVTAGLVLFNWNTRVVKPLSLAPLGSFNNVISAPRGGNPTNGDYVPHRIKTRFQSGSPSGGGVDHTAYVLWDYDEGVVDVPVRHAS
jgi:hypothetical protein